MSAAGSRYYAEFDLGLPKLSTVCRNDEVAHHCEFTAAAQSIACHSGNNRFSAGAYPFPVSADEVAHVDIHIATVLHAFYVCTSCKCFVVARHHQCADRIVSLELVYGITKFIHQVIGECVEDVRSVEDYQADVVVGFNKNVLVVHGCSSKLH